MHYAYTVILKKKWERFSDQIDNIELEMQAHSTESDMIIYRQEKIAGGRWCYIMNYLFFCYKKMNKKQSIKTVDEIISGQMFFLRHTIIVIKLVNIK